jgi:hypothetical protein
VTQLRCISPTLKAAQLTECKFQVAHESNSTSAPDFENTLTVGTSVGLSIDFGITQ